MPCFVLAGDESDQVNNENMYNSYNITHVQNNKTTNLKCFEHKKQKNKCYVVSYHGNNVNCHNIYQQIMIMLYYQT